MKERLTRTIKLCQIYPFRGINMKAENKDIIAGLVLVVLLAFCLSFVHSLLALSKAQCLLLYWEDSIWDLIKGTIYHCWLTVQLVV